MDYGWLWLALARPGEKEEKADFKKRMRSRWAGGREGRVASCRAVQCYLDLKCVVLCWLALCEAIPVPSAVKKTCVARSFRPDGDGTDGCRTRRS